MRTTQPSTVLWVGSRPPHAGLGYHKGARDLLKDHEVVAMYAYAGFHYDEINTVLRKLVGKEERKRLKPMIDQMITGLEKLPDDQGTTLRGGSLPADLLAQHRKGNIVGYDAFTSTAKEHSFLEPHQLRIQGKHGKDIGFLAPHAEEKEVLFLPNTHFRVLGCGAKL